MAADCGRERMSGDRVFAKCALHLIPFMMALYVANYIDRTNAGFAALTMNADLGFSAQAYGFGASILFVGYLLFQVPLGILLPRIGVRRGLFGILIVWGLLSASTALVREPIGFAVLRFCLGAAEAGFFPLMMLYLSRWFPRTYRTRFTAIFMASIPLASLIAGPLSGLVLQLDGVAGLAGWQWLFIGEGLPCCLLAVMVFAVLPETPADARWLDADEKRLIVSRVAAEDIARHRTVWPALRDPRVYALGLVNFAILFGITGVQLWLPLIVQSMGYSTFETSLISSAPYVVALPAMIAWGRLSDLADERVRFVAIAAMAAAVGFIATSMLSSSVPSLLAITLALTGLICMQPAFFSLLSVYLSGPAAAGGIALVIAISNVGSSLGPTMVGVIKQNTGGYGGAMAVFGVAEILAALLVIVIGRTMMPHKSPSALRPVTG